MLCFTKAESEAHFTKSGDNENDPVHKSAIDAKQISVYQLSPCENLYGEVYLALMSKAKHVREAVAHYLTGAVVLIKAYEKSEHFHEHPFITIFLAVLGVSIILATAFHHSIEKRIGEFKILLHILEALVLALVTYYYFSEGKKALPVVYSFTVIGHLIAAYFFNRKRIKNKKAVNDHH